MHAVAGAACVGGHDVSDTQHLLRDDLDEAFDVEGCVGHLRLTLVAARCPSGPSLHVLNAGLGQPGATGITHHAFPRMSSRRCSLASRRMYLGSVIGVPRNVSTIVSASPCDTSVAPRAITFAPLCWRAYRASV